MLSACWPRRQTRRTGGMCSSTTLTPRNPASTELRAHHSASLSAKMESIGSSWQPWKTDPSVSIPILPLWKGATEPYTSRILGGANAFAMLSSGSAKLLCHCYKKKGIIYQLTYIETERLRRSPNLRNPRSTDLGANATRNIKNDFGDVAPNETNQSYRAAKS